MGDDVALQAYTNDNQSAPPQEVADLFRDLEKVPRTQETLRKEKMFASDSASTRSLD